MPQIAAKKTLAAKRNHDFKGRKLRFAAQKYVAAIVANLLVVGQL
jgi:hypothetical protein